MFCLHMGFHVQSPTEDHLTNGAPRLALVHVLVFIQRTLV